MICRRNASDFASSCAEVDACDGVRPPVHRYLDLFQRKLDSAVSTHHIRTYVQPKNR